MISQKGTSYLSADKNQQSISAASSRAKEGNSANKLQQLINDVQQQDAEVKRQRLEIEQTKNLVWLGFVALVVGFLSLVVVVVSLIYGYWHFVYDNARNDDYRYGISEEINQNKTEIDLIKQEVTSLKSCLKAGGWRICF